MIYKDSPHMGIRFSHDSITIEDKYVQRQSSLSQTSTASSTL